MSTDSISIGFLLLWVTISLSGCRDNQVGYSVSQGGVSQDVATVAPTLRTVALTDDATLHSQIAAFCGGCHPPPLPGSFTKSEWSHEVKRGFVFYEESDRRDLIAPDEERVIEYFRTRAPNRIEVPKQTSDADVPGPISFSRAESAKSLWGPPATSCLKWLDLDDEVPRLVLSDMHSGVVQTADLRQKTPRPVTIANLAHPAMLSRCDLDENGTTDLVVAELGSLFSGDHHLGGVYWLTRDEPGQAADKSDAGGNANDDKLTSSSWRQRLIASGLGRVADVTPVHADDDGRLDLLLSEFGHVRTGSITLLHNQSVTLEKPRFQAKVIDDRAGTINTPMADFNGDGRLDFVALVSQEHESVDLFLNQGGGQFERTQIYRLADSSYGLSGIQIIDLDGDDDLDVLFSNGDTFGSHHLKPFHGIRWLENTGDLNFEHHLITKMIAVQRTLAADLDNDGDQDIVAVGFLPQNLVNMPGLDRYDSILWLEQLSPGKFRRHSLERGRFEHAALELADFDRDGDIDLAVGNFILTNSVPAPWFSVFWNPTL